MLEFILVKKKKLLYLTVLMLTISICLNACSMHRTKRPFEYPNSVWVCETPYISITINSLKETKAYLGKGADAQEFELNFGHGSDVDALKVGTVMISDETILFQGHCTFGENYFVIFLTPDNIWEGEYYKLYFERIE